MKFNDKYISEKELQEETAKDPNFKTTKVTLSNDAFAISEAVYRLQLSVERFGSKIR